MQIIQKILEEKSYSTEHKSNFQMTMPLNSGVSMVGGITGPQQLGTNGGANVSGAVTYGMQASAWLYTAITRKASTFAGVPLQLQYKGKDNRWRVAPACELSDLLESPNAWQSMQDAMEQYSMVMDIAGNALWYINRRSDGTILELQPVSPEYMRPIRTSQPYNEQYEWRDDKGAKRVIPASDVIHFMRQSPLDAKWGLSPLKSAALAVDLDTSAQRWQRDQVQAGAKPLAILHTSDADGEMSEAEWQAANATLNQQAQQRHHQFLLFSGIKGVSNLGFTPEEMDYLDSRRFSRDEICAVIGYPALLMDQSGTTYANMGSAMRHWWLDILIPALNDFTKTLQKPLLSAYGLDSRRYRIIADTSTVPALAENIQEKAQQALTLSQAGFSPESIALMLDLPLATNVQQDAQTALTGMSDEAKRVVEAKFGVDLTSLTPAQARALVYKLRGEYEG